MYLKKTVLITCICIVLFAQASFSKWETLEAGLELGLFNASIKSAYGDSRITVVRFDTAFFRLRLLSSAEFDSSNLTARQWCERYSLTAAINAGMYAKDYRTHTGLLKNYDYVNSRRVIKNYKTVLAFNPSDSLLPNVQIIDFDCQNFAELEKKYNSMVQNIRMIDCNQNNVWEQQIRTSSIAALGIDKSGYVLFMFSTSPYSTHDFIEIILELPLQLYNVMYLEGGAPASMCVMGKKKIIERCGISDGSESDSVKAQFSLPMPNAIGIERKPH